MNALVNPIPFTYKGEVLKLYEVGHYADGTPVLEVYDEDGLPYAKMTVSVPFTELADDEYLIKTWSENQALFEYLVAEKILEPVGRLVATGYVQAAVCRVNDAASH
jgi:hypothetical protein